MRPTLPAHTLVVLAPLVVVFLLLRSPQHQAMVLTYMAMASGAFFTCLVAIPRVAPMLLRRGLSGADLNKAGGRDGPRVPESLGLVCAVSWLLCAVMLQLVGSVVHDGIPLEMYNAALASVCAMVLLGFCDDVLDLKWRVKLVLPVFAALPLVMAYSGPTTIVVPKPLVGLLPTHLEMGVLYQAYMTLFAVFSTNTINIYAGINGLEVSQTLVIAAFCAIHNMIELNRATAMGAAFAAMHHMFSLGLVLPLVGVCFGLVAYNGYPSRVFVGDTFTYFAGMALAVSGILSHYSKTMLLLFIPQIANFVISLPQLLHIVPCPRHRLPRFDPETGKLVAVPEHWTLINVVLRVTGPLHERTLAAVLVGLQIACCSLGLAARYYGAAYFYGDPTMW